MKAFILLFIAILCAPAGLRGGNELAHSTDARAICMDRRDAQRESVRKRQEIARYKESRLQNGKNLAAQIAKTKKKQKRQDIYSFIAGVGILVLVSIFWTLMVQRKNKGNCKNTKNVVKCDLPDEWIRQSISLVDVPNGVSVSTLKDVSGYRIVYSRRRLGRMLVCAMIMLTFGHVSVQCVNSVVYLKEVYISFICQFLAFGIVNLLRELFGKDILELKPKESSYYAEEGRIFWGRWKNFPLSVKTHIYYQKRRVFKNIEHRDIVIKNEDMEEIAVGSSLPKTVQDYFVLCMSSWARGRPPIVSHGRTWHANIAHPFLFAIFALATVFCLSYALSCQERVCVRDGKICISETDLLGRCKTVAEIPTCDVASLRVHQWQVRRGVAGRTLRIIGHDRKVIARIGRLDVMADEYEREMKMALKGTGGMVFDRKRNNAIWSWRFVGLLWLVAIGFCGDGENRPKKDRRKK